ncbi:MAG: DNA-binding response regulator [Ancylobacter novellus]|uniref:DNA-binding response regulator n=1 Tax=Ancylobacter novellus TaxID=921 RepID=A0A2W5KB18_ANCNO|nr:MAG: DNA-binding response regulator [Ancylobacter novellus]
MTTAPKNVVIGRALVVDDHPIIHEALKPLLLDRGVGAVSAAFSMLAGFQAYRRDRPDLMIVDVNLGDDRLSGTSLIRRIRKRDAATPILALSFYPAAAVETQAIAAGASGFVEKSRSPAEILDAVFRAAGGSFTSGPQTSRRPADPSGLPDMNMREIKTLSLLGRGRTYKQISHDLGLSYGTVAEIGALLKYRFKAQSLQELVRIAAMLLFVA